MMVVIKCGVMQRLSSSVIEMTTGFSGRSTADGVTRRQR